MKILVVEDDGLFREAIKAALLRNGHDVVLAGDGDEAVQIAFSEKFDLVITDIFMPGKEGPETIQEIREMYPEIKIIAISSDGLAGRSSFLKIAEAMGANTTLQKPFTPAQLLEKVKTLG